MSAAREDLILKYAMACKRNASEMAGMPISVICQHFREFADELASLSTEAEGKPIAWLRPRDIARLSEASPGAINAQISNVNFQRWTVPVYAAPLPEDTHHGR